MLDALLHRDTRAAYPQVSAAGPGHLSGGAGAPERLSSAAWACYRQAERGPPGIFSTFWLLTPPCWTSDGPRGGRNCSIYGLVLYSLIIVLEAFSLKHVGCLEAFQIFFWPRPDFKIAGMHPTVRSLLWKTLQQTSRYWAPGSHGQNQRARLEWDLWQL